MSFLTDRKRKLIIGHDNQADLLSGKVLLSAPWRAQSSGYKYFRIFVPLHDINLFALKFTNNGLTLLPLGPTHAPTGSTSLWREKTATLERLPGSRAIALISTTPLYFWELPVQTTALTARVCPETSICGPLVVF